MCIHVNVFLWICFNISHNSQECSCLGCVIVACWIFQETAWKLSLIFFFNEIFIFHFSFPVLWSDLVFSALLLAFRAVRAYYFIDLNRYVVSHHDFNLHFLNDQWHWISFMCLFFILIFSVGEVSGQKIYSVLSWVALFSCCWDWGIF